MNDELKPRRYYLETCSCGSDDCRVVYLAERDDGEYVEASAYAALEARIAELDAADAETFYLVDVVWVEKTDHDRIVARLTKALEVAIKQRNNYGEQLRGPMDICDYCASTDDAKLIEALKGGAFDE